MSTPPAVINALRSLKGVPATLLLALLIHQQPAGLAELAFLSGYSTKSVLQGLRILEASQLVSHQHSSRTWTLNNTALLPRSIGLAAAALQTAVPAEENLPETEEISPQRPRTREKNLPEMENTSPLLPTAAALPQKNLPETEDFLPAPPPGPVLPQKKLPETEETSQNGKYFSSRARTTAAASTPTNPNQTSSSSSTAGPPAPPPAEIRNPQSAVSALLRRAGLGDRSPKMGHLLAQELDPAVVEAHVHEYLAQEAQRDGSKRPYPLGLLIRKLEDRDPPPPPRCPTCLRAPDRNGMCKCDYDAVIKR